MEVDLLEFVHEHTLVIFRVHAQGLAVEPGRRPCERVQEPVSIALVVTAGAFIEVFLDVAQDCIEFICLHVSVVGFPVRVHRTGVSSGVASARR